MVNSTIFHSGLYKNILEDLIADIKNIDGDYESIVLEAVNRCHDKAIRILEENARVNPMGFPVNLDTIGNWQEMVNTIVRKASETERDNRIFDFIAFGGYYYDSIGGKDYISPLYISWHIIQEKTGNVVISYKPGTMDIAVERLNNIALSILLSLPPKKVKLNIVDFGMVGCTGFFTSNLDPGIYHDEVIVDQSAYTNLLTRLSKTMAHRIKCLAANNDSRNNENLELVLFLGDPEVYDYHWNELRPIWENGRKCGIHFIALKDKTCFPQRDDTPPALEGLSYMELSDSIPQYSNAITHSVRVTPVAQVNGLAKLCFEYLNNGFQAKDKPVKILDTSYIDDEYEDCKEGILDVEIGRGERSAAHFTLDLVSHIHSFILGMSGSGKSVLLHNIIANLISKYSPEQLQLYLMDFKLGGVEFNRYRDTKHVKALLVDNSDNSVVLEILRELNMAMYERGKLLKSANVQRIDEYNRANPDNPMPQIIAVIDECHNIFKLEGDRRTGIQREVLSILTRITKEGRNQGVHIIMATQTLSDADIPGDILNNISDHYLLKCAQSDSDRLAPGSSTVTFGLPTGKIFYHHQSGTYLFQGYYIGDRALEDKVSIANKKALDRKSNGQFYFSGSQIFTLNDEVSDKIFSRNNLVLTPGETCSLPHQPIKIALPEQDSQNILITGIDIPNTTRTALALLDSAIRYNKKVWRKYHIVVINCLETDEDLQFEEDNGQLNLLKNQNERADFLGRLANDIECDNAKPTILFLIGQQLFRELKKDLPISVKVDAEPVKSTIKSDIITDADLLLDIPDLPEDKDEINFGFDETDQFFTVTEDSSIDTSPESSAGMIPAEKFTVNTTFGKALRSILTSGPEQGVHTVMLIDKPGNLLFEGYQSIKMIYGMFAHLLIHRSHESTTNALGLRDNILPENLTADEERLKAIYYNEEKDTYSTFSPYIIEQ